MIVNIKFLTLNENYYNQIIKLYSNFSSFNSQIFTFSKFKFIVENLPTNQYILFYLVDDNIVGAITLIIEQKLIHNGKCVGHIEDFVILEEYRKQDIGNILLQHVKILCEKNNCYKIILDCSPYLESYYEKKGYEKKGSYMGYYF